MSSDIPLAIVGNSLAALVAAAERARRGLRTLLVNPGGPWGGYFAGIDAGGERWDAGMVLYEFTSFRTPPSPPPLASYDAMRRSDVGRFCETVRAWVSRHQPTRDVEPPQMWLDGRLLPDLLLANGLAALPRLDCAAAARDALRAGIDAALASPLHASRKGEWSAATDFDTASRLNHGRVLHDAVIAPFARKVLGRDASFIAAPFHRVPWLPLYWPQTLLAALDGRPDRLPPTVFSAPRGARIAQLCARLLGEVEASPAVTVRRDGVEHIERTRDGFALRLQQCGEVIAPRLALALPPRQGLAACSADAGPADDPRLPLLLALLRVPRSALLERFSAVHAVAADTGIYRVVDASGCAAEDDTPLVRLVAEAHPDVFAARHGAATDDAAVRAVLDDLARMRLLRDGTQAEFSHVRRMPAALPLPTAAALARDADDRARLLELLPGVETLGACAGPFATSISDQIVQALAVASSRADAAALAAA